MVFTTTFSAIFLTGTVTRGLYYDNFRYFFLTGMVTPHFAGESFRAPWPLLRPFHGVYNESLLRLFLTTSPLAEQEKSLTTSPLASLLRAPLRRKKSCS